MSAIDIQNSRQIRDPMDVLITLTLGTNIALTYSGYSSAKVADGVLNQSSWPMRGLADLQGNGFPLDGSRVLYNPNTSPSQTNGKLGVRGNVGQPVSVTATGNDTIAALAISVTGAASVTLNGRTTEITGNRVTLQLLNTTAALTFQPSSEDRRIEIITVLPEADFVINNDNLIKATVSLRSDLSLFDQTLPESELNVEVYQDDDISEAVASIPEDTPITYQAGYPGDMSPVRKFYVSGQITWADNALNIRAVDSVHFLDNFVFAAPLETDETGAVFDIPRRVYKKLGLKIEGQASTYNSEWGTSACIIKEGTTARDLFAFLNQYGNVTDRNARLINDPSKSLRLSLQYGFVDAGIPHLYTYKSTPHLTIKEEDCADVKKSIDVKIGAVEASIERLPNTNWMNLPDQKVGTAAFVKNVGTSLSFDKYAMYWRVGLNVGWDYETEVGKKIAAKYGTSHDHFGIWPVVPLDSAGHYYPDHIPGFYNFFSKIQHSNIPQEAYMDEPSTTNEVKIYASFIPWAQRYNNWEYESTGTKTISTAAQMWSALRAAGIVSATDTSVELDIYAGTFDVEPQILSIVRDASAKTATVDSVPIIGQIAVRSGEDENKDTVIFPQPMLGTPLYLSPETGSFLWKGDPRLQPREQVYFRRLDGNLEEITLENITITHVGGGTSAEITYRKVIV